MAGAKRIKPSLTEAGKARDASEHAARIIRRKEVLNEFRRDARTIRGLSKGYSTLEAQIPTRLRQIGKAIYKAAGSPAVLPEEIIERGRPMVDKAVERLSRPRRTKR